MITPVFGSLSPRSAARQQRQAEPAIPLPPPQPNGNPVLNNEAAIPGILEGIQQIMQQRRAQHPNVVRFGMNAQPPQEAILEDLPVADEDGEEEEPATPPHQGIPQVVPNAPWVNHVAPPIHNQQHQQDGAIQPPVFGPMQNLLAAFNVAAQQNQQPVAPPAPPTPANPFAQARANIHSPQKPSDREKE